MSPKIRQCLSAIQTAWRVLLFQACPFTLLCLLSYTSFCQNTVSFQLPIPTTIQDLSFYLVELEDHRENKTNRIGQIITTDHEAALVLRPSFESSLYNYFKKVAPSNGKKQIPVYFKISELEIKEKKDNKKKVTGTVKLKIEFSWFRDASPVFLTTYETSASFTRPIMDSIYERIIPSLLNGSAPYLEKWIQKNQGKTSVLLQNLVVRFSEDVTSSHADTVYYHPNKPLQWADFKGSPQSRLSSKYAAAVFSSFSYEGKSYPEGDSLVVEIILKAFMVKNNSWVRLEAMDHGSLKHEQAHFDLTRIAAENFKKRVLKADLTVEDHDSEIQYQYIEAFREMNKLQKQYDWETKHGINKVEQASWENKINKQIMEIYGSQQ